MNNSRKTGFSAPLTVCIVIAGTAGCGSSNPPEFAFACVAGPDAGKANPAAAEGDSSAVAIDSGTVDEEIPSVAPTTNPHSSVSIPSGGDAVCTEDAWCFEVPSPQGNPLYAVFGTDSSDVWMMGDLGTALHFDGKNLAKVATPSTARIEAIWAATSTLAYATTAAGELLRYDGTAWTSIPLPLLVEAGAARPAIHALSATGPGDLWAVGDAGLVLHFDGASWTTSTSGTTVALRSVFALDAQNVWAAGDKGTLLRYDGAAFSVVSSGVSVTLRAIHGSALNDIWVVGDKGTSVHYDGKRWSRRDTGGQDDLYSVRVENPDSVWAVGNHGMAWHWMIVPTINEAGADLDAGAGLADAADAADTRARKWFATTSGTSAGLRSVWGNGSGELWAVGELGSIVRWNNDSVVRLSRGSGTNRLSIAGLGPEPVWVVGDEITRRTADGWATEDSDNLRALYGVGVASANEAWAVGTAGTILHLTATDAGSSWTPVRSPTTRWLRGVWLTGEMGGFIVGQAGTILGLLNGSSWMPVTSGVSADLRDVWGASADDVWAVGASGTLLHWHGSSWTLVPNGPDGGVANELRGVWGSSSRDVWAVGAGGAIVHCDGSTWSVVQSGQSYSLNDVWGSSGTDVWAVGTSGRILHWNGASWMSEASGTLSSLNALWGNGKDRVWVVGEDGTILRHDRK